MNMNQGNTEAPDQSSVTPASEYADIIASYEAYEGYPSEAWIDAFNAMSATALTAQQAADFLVNQLPIIAKTISCMRVEVSNGKDDYFDKPLKRIEYITGGWSGAEDLIDAMLRQFWVSHFHSLWKRGGYFVFEVPASFLEASAVTPDRTATDEQKEVR